MIKEYFFTNILFYITQLKVDEKYLIFNLKISNKIPKHYYIYILKNLYNIFPQSINVKSYGNYYKIITLKYLL